jgi:hypothetical protein
MINYSIEEIEELIDKEQFSPKIKVVAEIILTAINDWPNPIGNFYDYDLAVQNFIMNTTTKKNIELALSKIDISIYAWEAESFSSLLEVFDHFEKNISLKEIIENVIQEQSPI